MGKGNTLDAGSASVTVNGGSTVASLYRPATGSGVDIKPALYGNAENWRNRCTESNPGPPEFEDRFLSALDFARVTICNEPLYRGRNFRGSPMPLDNFGPPSSKNAIAGRYNLKGSPVLYLCDDPKGVREEVASLPGEDLWVQQFRLPSKISLVDTRFLSRDSFANAVFFAIENALDDPAPALGARVAGLVTAKFHESEGMIVRGVRAKGEFQYANVVIFRPEKRWTDWLDSTVRPQLYPRHLGLDFRK
jgi:hypothetical protein